MSQLQTAENTPPQEDFTALSFNNVKYSYADNQSPAVNGVTFSVKKGEFVSVIGHNGSGKSTLARLACGLLEADEGTINVLGLDLSDRKNIFKARRHTGIVFQNPDNQMVASIVEDDIAFGPENLGVEREEIGRRIEWALDAVGMTQFRHSTPTRLSGGQKQRIAVAGVLAIRPDILILDESTAMLDPRGRREVIEVVRRLNKEDGMTILLITHFMEEALLADRTIVMNRGEIVMQGEPQKIFENGEALLTYNLTLPEITQIADRLRSGGIDTPPCLHPEELARSIAQCASDRGLTNLTSPRLPADSGEKRGAWDIDIKNLTYTYSAKSPFAAKALSGVNLHIGDGEFFGIIGHTGSGKSTLIQHLNALIKLPQANKKYKLKKLKKEQTPPTMPELTVGDYNLADKKCNFLSLRADVGMVFQYPEYQLFAESVFEDVAFGLKNFFKDLSEDEVKERVNSALAAVGLDPAEVGEKSPFDLSGGQKRRVAIAGVIVTRPKILVLDEPAAGLDPLGKKEIMELLHKLHSEWCRTVIIVSHDMDEIACNCTRACVVSDGKIFDCAAPHELFARYDELISLGLDVPLTAKICRELKKYGIDIDCDFTPESFADAVICLFEGVKAVLNDVAFGQYYPAQSFAHKLDPRLKLLFLIAYIVALFVARTFYGLALCAVFIIAATFISKVPFGSVLRSVKGILFLLVFTALLNLFMHSGEHLLVEWGIIHIYLEGVLFALFLMFRLIFLVLGSALLTLTTTPVSLTDGLESLLKPLKYIKFPVHALALIMSIALRFIPTLMDETNRIIAAQKARGADFESGSLVKRVKAIIPILIPLLISAFRRAEELGDAMDARCYTNSPNRTKYKKLNFTWRDLVAALVGGALIAGVVLFNIYAYDIFPAAYPYVVIL